MPTFENGWICRECWSANREFDARCYRCHKDRPETAGPVELAGKQTTDRAAPVVEAVAPEAPAQPEVEAVAPATASRPGVRYCLRCGHELLAGASFCTRCGSATSPEEAVAAVAAPQPVVATRGKAARPTPAARARVTVPSLPRMPMRELAARVPVTYSGFIGRHEMTWEAAMSSLAAAFVLMQLLPRWLPSSAGWAGGLAALITGIYLLEYATRLGAAEDRRWFVRHHILEGAALLPPLRALRILRFTWLKWLEPGWRSIAKSWSLPPRLTWRAMSGRALLLIGWSLLLLLIGVLVLGVGTGEDIRDQAPLFALLMMCLAILSGVTGSVVTLLAVRHDTRSTEAYEGLSVLARMREAGRLDATEYAALRRVLVNNEVPEAARTVGGSASRVEAAASTAGQSA